MNIPSIFQHRNIALPWFVLCCFLLTVSISGCGEEYSSSTDTGSYTCTLTWPEGVPTLETTSRSSRAIDCDAAGVATVAFDFYDGSGTYLTGDAWSCSLHEGIVHGIRAGGNRRLVVTGKDSFGTVLYRAGKNEITITAGQTTQGGEIGMTYVYWTMLKLPDTGQTQSYTDTFGEDSDYTINPPSYTDNGDGTVTDNVTGLMWQQGEVGSMNWEDAITCCEALSLAGYTDWRLRISRSWSQSTMTVFIIRQ